MDRLQRRFRFRILVAGRRFGKTCTAAQVELCRSAWAAGSWPGT